MIKRYEMHAANVDGQNCDCDKSACELESRDGDWCKYDDVAEMQVEHLRRINWCETVLQMAETAAVIGKDTIVGQQIKSILNEMKVWKRK